MNKITDKYRKLGVGETLAWGDMHADPSATDTKDLRTCTLLDYPVREDDEVNYYRPLYVTSGEVDNQAGTVTKMVAFGTGSKREDKTGKGRFDLIPFQPMLELAQHYETGGKAHGDRNWELGQPLSVYLSAMRRHSMQTGITDNENHAAAVAWNAFAYIATRKWIREGKLPQELNDVPVA